MKFQLFTLFMLVICYAGGMVLSLILAPVLLIKNPIEIGGLSLFFMTVFYIISLFIRDRL